MARQTKMSRKSNLPLAFLVGLLCLLSTGTARADRFAWSYNVTGDSASGELTTTALSGGQARITAFAGTYNGSPIDALLPPGALEAGVTLQSGAICPANDNVLYVPGPFLDCAGVAFDAGGLEVNLYYLGSAFLYATTNRDIATGSVVFGNSGGIFTVARVPEPSTLLLLFVGLPLLAIVVYRRDLTDRWLAKPLI
jgi:hypothetical protein